MDENTFNDFHHGKMKRLSWSKPKVSKSTLVSYHVLPKRSFWSYLFEENICLIKVKGSDPPKNDSRWKIRGTGLSGRSSLHPQVPESRSPGN